MYLVHANFLHLHAVFFKKKGQMMGWRPRSWRSPSWKFWIRNWNIHQQSQTSGPKITGGLFFSRGAHFFSGSVDDTTPGQELKPIAHHFWSLSSFRSVQ